MASKVGKIYNLEIKIPVTLTALATVVSALFVLAFWKRPDIREELKFAGLTVGVSAALIGAYLNRRALQATIEDRQLSAVNEFYLKYYCDEHMKEVRSQLKAIRHELSGKTATQMVELLKNDDVKAAAVNHALNFWEVVGYSVRAGRIATRDVKSLMGTACLSMFRDVQPWLVEYRRQRNQTTAWEHFQWLAEQLK